MAKKKKQQKYNPAEMKVLEQKLNDHRTSLEMSIRALPINPTFDDAVECRDSAQYLVTTCLVIQSIPDTILLSGLSGEPQAIPFLSNCGLDY